MSALSRTALRTAPPVEWAWQYLPLRPTPQHPAGFAGLLKITVERSTGKSHTEQYLVSPIVAPESGREVLGWRLTKADRTQHDIDDLHWTCDCAAATFHDKPCKHVIACYHALQEVPYPDPRDDHDAPAGHDNLVPF